jgi:DNA-binding transcriptional regulator YhcF (GntR family)
MSMKRNDHSINDMEARLAARLLGVELGERLPSVRALASKTDMSIGAVSNALNHLEEMGAVQIQKRGHLGFYLEGRSVADLWKVAERGSIVIAFTIPSNLRFEGLATALKTLLSEAGIEACLIFIRGSSTRIRALREKRCHAVVLLELTVIREWCPKEIVAMNLPVGARWSDTSCISGRKILRRWCRSRLVRSSKD